MKVRIDKELCSGDEICVEICPEVFQMEDDVAVAKVDVVPSEAEESAQQAADDCPAEAIIIEE